MSRPRLGWWAAIVAVISALALTAAVACGDDNGDDGDGNSARTPAAQPTPSDSDNGDNGDDSSGNGGGDAGDFESAFNRFNTGTFTVVLSVSGDDTGGLTELTIVKDGPDKTSFVFSSAEGSGRFIQNGDRTAFCVDASQFADLDLDISGDEACFGNDSPFGDADEFTSVFDFEEDDLPEVLSSRRETIAGEEADCFETRETDGVLTTGCIGRRTGALLRIISEGVTYEATSVSGNVDQSAFNIPELTEFPGF